MLLLELAQDARHASGPTEKVTLHFPGSTSALPGKKGFATFAEDAGSNPCR